jgi:peptidoglycan/LPS O-acetylase OafA/YrhL
MCPDGSAPQVQPLASSRYYRPELDLLRFIAFLCVFCTHRLDLAPMNPEHYFWSYHICLVGVFGVPVFFLLSAFLITELLTRERERTGTINYKAFYIRRMLRIWPLYFGLFFGLVALSYFFPIVGHIPAKSWLPFSLFAGNWYISSNFWIPSYPVNLLWSVSVEEQFYIIIPLLACYGGYRSLKVLCFVALAVAYACIAMYASHPTAKFNSEWTNSFVHFQFFSAGVLLSLYFKGWQPRWPMAVRLLMAATALGCWLLASLVFGIHADAPHLSTVPQAICGWMLVLFGAILLLLGLLGTPKKYLPRPLVYLGRISYGLYIFHAGVYFLVYVILKQPLERICELANLQEWKGGIGMMIAFAATVAIASVSYRYFERPFLRLKERFTIVPSRTN